MKAAKYIVPKMKQIELGSRAIALGIQGSDHGEPDTELVKGKSAWDDEEVEWK